MARRIQEREIEVYPEADSLAGFPHPRHTRAVFGHMDEETALRDAFSAGRMHHAWILAGASGIGKATLAYRLARYILADPSEISSDGRPLDTEVECATSRQVGALSHPRLMLIRRPYDIKAKRFTASIPVDAVRSVKGFLSSRGEATHWRVVIVDTADEMNVNAANALLKSLEEPPPRTVFLLLSSEPGRLLNTIRSRCRRLQFSSLSNADLKAAVDQALAASEDATLDDANYAELAPLAAGSVRRLLSLHALKGAELAQAVQTILGQLPDVDWSKVHRISDELAPVAAAERFEVFFDLLFRSLHGCVRTASGAPLETGEPPNKALNRLSVTMAGTTAGSGADTGNLANWAEAWDSIQNAKSETQALNLDRKSLILETVGRLAQTAGAR
ncbi:MAG: DNA polymerase III subunit delta' [Pseudomonadota bacterium]